MVRFNNQDYTTFFVLVNIHYEICRFNDEICKKRGEFFWKLQYATITK